MRLLVTGASGFVGSAVVRRGLRDGWSVVGADRRVTGRGVEVAVDIGPETDWRHVLHDVDAIIHLAGVVHRRGTDEREHVRVDVHGSRRLAEQAAAAGVRRIVYMSTLAVHGVNAAAAPVTETTPLAPRTAYGRARVSAEKTVAATPGIETVMVRAPLVYGPNAPANFGALVRAVRRGLPLPFRGVHNERSMVGRDNLADFLVTAATHPAAASQTFVVADEHPLSTERLVRLIAEGCGRGARLFRLPGPVVRAARSIPPTRRMADSLFGSLVVDASHARETLGWKPPVAIDHGVRAAARETTA